MPELTFRSTKESVSEVSATDSAVVSDLTCVSRTVASLTSKDDSWLLSKFWSTTLAVVAMGQANTTLRSCSLEMLFLLLKIPDDLSVVSFIDFICAEERILPFS